MPQPGDFEGLVQPPTAKQAVKSPADMLASDLRSMAAIIPAGWRAAVLMVAILILLFPLLASILVLDALTHDMPVLRHPLRHASGWLAARLHRSRSAFDAVPPAGRIRHAN